MPIIRELREYEETVLALTEEEARLLVAAAPEALAVSPAGSVGHWKVKAAGHVGTITLPGLSVLIRPKVGLESVLYLLDAGMPDAAWRNEVFQYGSQQDLLAAFAAFFARSVDRATNRGLLRSYRDARERLMALRGRIDFREQIRRPAVPIPIACAYEDYTADVNENRFVLGGIERLLRALRLDPGTRSLLIRLRARFEDVLPVLPSRDQLDGISFDRLNAHYRPALQLVSFISQNLSLHDRAGTQDASTFLIDMAKLYEDWVTRKLRAALHGQFGVESQTRRHLDVERRVSIRPDLEIHHNGAVRYVGDVKYKLSRHGLARTADYYQLLAYATALNLPEGILIYAQAEGEMPDREVTVRHAGNRLVTYRLDLSGSFDSLDRSIAQLAKHLRDRVNHPAPVAAGLASASSH